MNVESGKRDRSTLVIAVLLPLAVGALSALLSGGASSYEVLRKPALSPPGIVFPIVWTVLYLLMGISSYLIYETGERKDGRALKLYALQLFFNFGWSILFFGFENYLLAFWWLLILIVLIVLMIREFYGIRPIAAYLQIPYLLWCLFAAYLNIMVYRLNP